MAQWIRLGLWVCVVLASACTQSTKAPTAAEPVTPPKQTVTMAVKSPVDGPRVRILGIAQDGGLPHAACSCAQCTAARKDPGRASFVASLGIIAPSESRAYLIDATPDIIAQLEVLSDVRTLKPGAVDRAPVDGVFLTHAHMGHYLGLAHLGFEAVNTHDIPVWCSERMGGFLTHNAPWGQLIRKENLTLHTAFSGTSITLADGIQVTPLSVPHRAEYTDTFGFYVAGKRGRILYIPDTSPWDKWATPMEAAFEGVDVALLDGTFYSGDELPGRDISKIGHPLIVDTMDRLQARVDAGKLQVYFIHLNHSNPALDPASTARKAVEKRGFHIGRVGVEFAL